MRVRRTVPQVALVVKWPAAVADEAVVRQAVRRIVDARLAVTWSIENASQAQALSAWSALRFGGDAALIVDADALSTARGETAMQSSRRLRSRVEQIRAAGVNVDAIHAQGDMAKTAPRSLGSAGLSAIVTDADGPAVRSLPLGLWQFAPCVSLPRVRRWSDFFRRPPRWIPTHDADEVTLATIDLARVAAQGDRAWRACERQLGDVAEARAAGTIAVLCVADVAAQLAAAHAVKPQCSILRAAA